MVLVKQYSSGADAASAVQAWADSMFAKGTDLSGYVAAIDCDAITVFITTRSNARKKTPWLARRLRKELKARTCERELLIFSFDSTVAKTHLYSARSERGVAA